MANKARQPMNPIARATMGDNSRRQIRDVGATLKPQFRLRSPMDPSDWAHYSEELELSRCSRLSAAGSRFRLRGRYR